MPRLKPKHIAKSGFTIVELIVVISIIGILATISVVGYGAWRNSATATQVKSDLNAVAAAMEDARTFNNGYPTTLPTTVTPSENVTLTLQAGSTTTAYCVDAVSSDNPTLTFYVASETKDQGALEGTCATRPNFASPATPTGLAVNDVSDDYIKLGWNTTSNASEYTVQCATDAGYISGLKSLTVASPTVTATVSSLDLETIYYCRLKATNSSGSSSWTSTVSDSTGNSNFWTDIKVASRHVLAKKADGSLWSWGINDSGQVGNGTIVNQSTPVQILTGVTDFYTQGQNGYAIKTDGSLWAWGDNNFGLAGNNNGTTDQTTPVQIIASGVEEVYALNDTSTNSGTMYAKKTDGSLWAWSYNTYGAVGNSTTTTQRFPVQVIASGVSKVANDVYTVYVIKTDGSLWAWGRNNYGQVGNGTIVDQTSPTQIIASGVSDVQTHKYTVSALMTDGSLWSWGYNYHNGTGNGGDSAVNQLTPVQIIASGVSEVTQAWYGGYAIKTDGSLWSWGWNTYGQVGNGATTDQPTPVQVIASGVSDVYVDKNFSATATTVHVKKTDGTVWGWGYNGNGKVGNGTSSSVLSPDEIMSNVDKVYPETYTTHILKTDGSLWATGLNTSGQIGAGGSTTTTPIQILTGVSLVAKAIFGDTTYALKDGGSLWANGSNTYLQVGNGSSAGTVTTPTLIPH